MAAKNTAMEILKERFANDGDFDVLLAQESVNCRVAIMVYEARTKAQLTQKDLADLVGTSQQAISRLEDADYEGHSLSMLQRIADSLGRRIEIQLVPKEEPQHA